jgi:hypothetical protein
MKLTRNQLRKVIKEELDNINQQHRLTENSESSDTVPHRSAYLNTMWRRVELIERKVIEIEKQTAEILRLLEESQDSVSAYPTSDAG